MTPLPPLPQRRHSLSRVLWSALPITCSPSRCGALLDQRSDLFSFGITLCDLLAETNPFRRDSATEAMGAILRDAPSLAGDLPRGLMILIRRLLAKDLSLGYQSVADVAKQPVNRGNTELRHQLYLGIVMEAM